MRHSLPVVLTLSCAAALAACRGSRSLVKPPPTAVPTFVDRTPAPPPAVIVCPSAPSVAVQPERPALPPGAKPGEVWCYIRVPAVTQTVSENAMVTPASCREEYVPPVTQEVTEPVVLKPEERRKIAVAAEYADQQEQVLVADSKTEWRKVDCQPKNMNQGEQVGECWTLIQMPPQYATRTSRVCVRPESFREEVIPAQMGTQTRTVVVQEGFTKKIEIPPVYEVRTREVEVSPARWEWRRTSECDVPGGDAPAPGGEPQPAPGAPAQVPASGQPGIPPAPAYDLPPAGALPPAEVPATR